MEAIKNEIMNEIEKYETVIINVIKCTDKV